MTIKTTNETLTVSDSNATQPAIQKKLKDFTLTSGFRYPQNLGKDGQKAFISFGVKDSVKLFNREPEIEETVHLYLPSSLKVKYGTSYEEVSLDYKKAKSLGLGAVNLFSGIRHMTIGAHDARAAAQTFANTLNGITGGSSTLQAGIATGLLANPHMAVAFTGVEFRKFTFSFQLMPKNPQETEAVRQIIKFFKKNMHPTLEGGVAESGRWLIYPKNFDISLNSPIDGDVHMFQIKTCALESCDVDYAGSGTPSFFNTGAPVDVRLDLSFRELIWLTRQDFEGDNNF